MVARALGGCSTASSGRLTPTLMSMLLELRLGGQVPLSTQSPGPGHWGCSNPASFRSLFRPCLDICSLDCGAGVPLA